jgi:SAM-dependent methyltransferase
MTNAQAKTPTLQAGGGAGLLACLYQRDLAYIQAAAFGALARGAAPEVVRRLHAARCPIRHVVDVGCGAGPLTQALVDAGFEVMGIDCSAELLEIARVAVPTAHFINASIHDTAIPACDAIVALGEPLTYHAEGDDADLRVRQFFQRASAALPPGGVLIFDIIERRAISKRAGMELGGRLVSAGGYQRRSGYPDAGQGHPDVSLRR